MKKHVIVVLCCAVFACCALVPMLSSAQIVANRQQVLTQARHAYYNLRDEGLAEFECSVTPNWKALLADQRKADPAGADSAINTLSQLQFNAKLGADGKVKLTHNELSGQSEEMKKALAQIYGGMEQMTSGFFETWSLFMLDHPFPEVASEYQLEAVGPQYRLSYKDGAASVATTMGRDFAISSLDVTSKEFKSSIQPKFNRIPKGLLFSAYDASYTSNTPTEATQLKVQIGYQEVDGMQVLKQLNLSGTYGGSPFAVELAFSDCKVKKKQ
ncbi:MAG TPA: hypothetical protein VI685_19440 [Candidatus Angelobacter sp.]